METYWTILYNGETHEIAGNSDEFTKLLDKLREIIRDGGGVLELQGDRDRLALLISPHIPLVLRYVERVACACVRGPFDPCHCGASDS